MGILEQLRQKQREAGLPPAPANPEAPVEIPGFKPGAWNKSLVAITPTHVPITTPSEPSQPEPQKFEQEFDKGTGRGYIKLFPPTVQSLKELKPEWIAENWGKPSPWCSIEGMPDHPDFEKNLKAI